MNFRVYVRPRHCNGEVPWLDAPSRVTIQIGQVFFISPANTLVTCEDTRSRLGYMRSNTKWNRVLNPAHETPILGAVLQKLVGQSLALQWLLNRDEKLDYAIDAGSACVLLRHINPTVSVRDMEWWEPMIVEESKTKRWMDLKESPQINQVNAVLSTAILKLVDAEVMARNQFGARLDLRFDDFYNQVQALQRRIAGVRATVLPYLPVAGSTHRMRFMENGKRLILPDTVAFAQ